MRPRRMSLTTGPLTRVNLGIGSLRYVVGSVRMLLPPGGDVRVGRGFGRRLGLTGCVRCRSLTRTVRCEWPLQGADRSCVMHTVERVDPVFGVVYRVVRGKRK